MYTEHNEQCPRCREGSVIEVSDPSKVMELDEPVTVGKACSSPGFGVYLHPVEETLRNHTEVSKEHTERCPRCCGGDVLVVGNPSKINELESPVTIEKVCNSAGAEVYLHPVENL